MNTNNNISIHQLKTSLSGELFTNDLYKTMYATDASVYRKIPMGVVYPKNKEDIKILIDFATKNNISLIPRAAGTSLAGQCVGEGLVVDISKHFTRILAFDERKKTVTVEPGVIRDELNNFLKPYGLFFGPNTSTGNRCMIGGMVGNNSSGTTSIKYGVTRDKALSVKAILSDGNEVIFSKLSFSEFLGKRRENSLEGKIYQMLFNELSNESIQREIRKEFPRKTIHRRNNGYAVDALLDFKEFGGQTETINLAALLSGSEGTLSFTTEITLQLDELPPPKSVMVAAHFESIQESMEAVVIAMKHDLFTCELMDKTILDCTKSNREQLKNRFFLEGDPKAILMLEFCSDTDQFSNDLADKLIDDLKNAGLGYAFPKLQNENITKALELRKAGLGLLGNMVGDDKAVACIEDTAVEVKDLPEYISEFTQMMEAYGQEAVYYAHAGAGELHLRPILNLKKQEDVILFREITTKVAALVKKYGGSFSGEHGDGIVRAEFIPMMIGTKNYELLKRIKQVFDPEAIFNPGKIVDAYPMDKNLRYQTDRVEPEIATIQDFSDSLGILRATEKCNGSGDCRKSPSAGGTMCPSYRATRNEKDTTRARANVLREYLTNSEKPNRFNHEELFDVFDQCLSCKACASECPSNVDIATLKSEFLYQYYRDNKIPFRTKLFAENVKWSKKGRYISLIINTLLNIGLVKKFMGIAPERSIPKLAFSTVEIWYKKNKKYLRNPHQIQGELNLFVDEFTNYYDTCVGRDTIQLLTELGYRVNIVNHEESGRSFISKGLLDRAKEKADANISIFKGLVSENTPLVGIEPSAILTFRDEYLRLAEDKVAAQKIARNTYTVEEFIQQEFKRGNIRSDQFTRRQKNLKVHGHCHQKSLGTMESSFTMLSIPKNYRVTILNTGCCGMAGSFGYEAEHYKLSMQVGENSLFPKIRNLDNSVEIVSSGTSCRHQIKDGTNKKAKHPVTVLKEALL